MVLSGFRGFFYAFTLHFRHRAKHNMKISSKPHCFVLEGTNEDFWLSGFERPCNGDPIFTMLRSFFLDRPLSLISRHRFDQIGLYLIKGSWNCGRQTWARVLAFFIIQALLHVERRGLAMAGLVSGRCTVVHSSIAQRNISPYPGAYWGFSW